MSEKVNGRRLIVRVDGRQCVCHSLRYRVVELSETKSRPDRWRVVTTYNAWRSLVATRMIESALEIIKCTEDG